MNPDRKRICLVKNEPEAGKYGDCIRACIATLVDRDDVPHPFTTPDNTITAWGTMRHYLEQEHRKNIALFAMDEHFAFMAENNPGVPYMLLHQTHRGAHAVICQDGRVIHDPAWYKSEITGPLASLGAYIIAIITDVL